VTWTSPYASWSWPARTIGQRLWPLMDHDDRHVVLKAIATYLRVMDYRAKITGLYNAKPPRQEAVPAEVHAARGEEVLAKVHRLMVLTNQVREENVAGMIDVEPVEAGSAEALPH